MLEEDKKSRMRRLLRTLSVPEERLNDEPLHHLINISGQIYRVMSDDRRREFFKNGGTPQVHKLLKSVGDFFGVDFSGDNGDESYQDLRIAFLNYGLDLYELSRDGNGIDQLNSMIRHTGEFIHSLREINGGVSSGRLKGLVTREIAADMVGAFLHDFVGPFLFDSNNQILPTREVQEGLRSIDTSLNTIFESYTGYEVRSHRRKVER